MSYQRRPTPPQRGFTALELIIVLVIGFSIIALSASKMGDMFNNSKTARAMSGLLDLSTTIRSLQGPDGYGKDKEDITKALKDSKMVPKSFRTTADKILNDWNGSLTVVISNNGQGFTINYPALPKGICTKLARGLLQSSLFTSLTVEGTPLTEASLPQEVMSACAPTSTAVDVTLLLEVDGPAPTTAPPASTTTG